MARKVLGVVCGLVLCLALVALTLCVGVQAYLLRPGAAMEAMQKSGHVEETTARMQNTLEDYFAKAGLMFDPLVPIVTGQLAEDALAGSVQGALNGGDIAPQLSGTLAPAREDAVAALETGGNTVTEAGLAQLDALLALGEETMQAIAVAPMAGVLQRLSAVFGGAWLVPVLALVALAALGGALAVGLRTKMAGLYIASGFAGAGLVLLAAGLVFGGGAGQSAVMQRFYEGFYAFLPMAGAVGLVLGVAIMLLCRLLARKKG